MRGVVMQSNFDLPECKFCHSQSLELSYIKVAGVLIECSDCGFSAPATNEHLESETMILKIAG